MVTGYEAKYYADIHNIAVLMADVVEELKKIRHQLGVIEKTIEDK